MSNTFKFPLVGVLLTSSQRGSHPYLTVYYRTHCLMYTGGSGQYYRTAQRNAQCQNYHMRGFTYTVRLWFYVTRTGHMHSFQNKGG